MPDEIIRDITAERLRQRESLGFDHAHDAEHGPADWASMIIDYASRITSAAASGGDNPAMVRENLVKIGALAFAAIESRDAHAG